jgi:hypothetical protein
MVRSRRSGRSGTGSCKRHLGIWDHRPISRGVRLLDPVYIAPARQAVVTGDQVVNREGHPERDAHVTRPSGPSSSKPSGPVATKCSAAKGSVRFAVTTGTPETKPAQPALSSADDTASVGGAGQTSRTSTLLEARFGRVSNFSRANLRRSRRAPGPRSSRAGTRRWRRRSRIGATAPSSRAFRIRKRVNEVLPVHLDAVDRNGLEGASQLDAAVVQRRLRRRLSEPKYWRAERCRLE